MSAVNGQTLDLSARVTLAQDLRDCMERAFHDIESSTSTKYDGHREHYINQLDAVVLDLKRLSRLITATLAGGRNTLIPAASMPIEVLIEIFSYAGTISTLAASHVCHAWRAATTGVWTYVDMNDPSFSEGRLKIQLSRAGDLPIDFNFNFANSFTYLHNVKVPENIDKLLPRARSISNLCINSSRSRVDMRKLESLHAILADRPLDECIESCPKLTHLSLENVLSRLPKKGSKLLSNLRTLHLQGGWVDVTAFVGMLSALPHLRELVLHDFRTDGQDDIASSSYPVSLSNLELLTLSQLSHPFLSQLLSSTTLAPSTNLRINHSMDSYDIKNEMFKCGARTICIDARSRLVYYDHLVSTSELRADRGLGRLPLVICHDSVSLLSWTTETPYPDFPWKTFNNLHSLSFPFTPILVNGLPTGLAYVLTYEVRKNCPQLEYIGIVLRKPQPGSSARPEVADLDLRDHAEKAIPNFLKAWLKEYRKRFHRIRVQDERNSTRWKAYLPILEPLVDHFELGAVSLDIPRKPVPLPRRFKP